MIDGIQNIFRIPELKKRLLYTFGLLAVYRVGAFIPTPGIDSQALARYFENVRGTILGFFNMFSGGALEPNYGARCRQRDITHHLRRHCGAYACGYRAHVDPITPGRNEPLSVFRNSRGHGGCCGGHCIYGSRAP